MPRSNQFQHRASVLQASVNEAYSEGRKLTVYPTINMQAPIHDVRTFYPPVVQTQLERLAKPLSGDRREDKIGSPAGLQKTLNSRMRTAEQSAVRGG